MKNERRAAKECYKERKRDLLWNPKTCDAE
jgi:hypothetical protein